MAAGPTYAGVDAWGATHPLRALAKKLVHQAAVDCALDTRIIHRTPDAERIIDDAYDVELTYSEVRGVVSDLERGGAFERAGATLRYFVHVDNYGDDRTVYICFSVGCDTPEAKAAAAALAVPPQEDA